MMTSLHTEKVNNTEVEKYPRGHPVYKEMGLNARNLKDKSGDIWQEGLFIFQRKMDQDFAKIERNLFEVPCNEMDDDYVATILQVKVK
jgi:hypothetical protein